MRQLVLDDRDAGHEGVDAGRALGGQVVGRGRDQLGVTADREGVFELLQVLRGHLRRGLYEVALGEEGVEPNLVRGRHGPDCTHGYNRLSGRLVGFVVAVAQW